MDIFNELNGYIQWVELDIDTAPRITSFHMHCYCKLSCYVPYQLQQKKGGLIVHSNDQELALLIGILAMNILFIQMICV